MKIFIKIASVIVLLSLVLSMLILPASAAKGAVLYFSKNTVEVGDKVTVSVSINPDKKMYAVAFYLEYNDEVLKFESGSGVANAGVLQVVESPSGDKSVKYSFTFTALKVGSSVFSVKDCTYDIQGADGLAQTQSFGGASAKMTVKDPELSSNAKLKSLKVNGYSLSPSFSSSKTSYTLKVKNDVTKVNISATTDDENAKVVSVDGNTNLKEGANTVTVTVEAQNGTQKKYTIKVTRAKADESEEEETKEDEEETEESTETNLQTIVDGTEYLIVTKLPKNVLFGGFEVEKTMVNGLEIETAVDEEGFYRLFYLQTPDSDKLEPYLYDADLDEFQKFKYINFNNKNYIFDVIPEDFNVPETMYRSTVEIGDFSVDCLSDSYSNLSDFHYVYCFVDGKYSIYRYDSLEETLQRYPDLELNTPAAKAQDDSFFARFSSLSTNAKIIFIGLIVLILGAIALLVMLIVYLIRKSYVQDDDVILTMNDVGFDSIEMENNQSNLK